MSYRNHFQLTFLFFQYTPEVYPTTLRSIGVGSCSSMARFGAMLTPYIAQVLLLRQNKTRSYKDECSTGSNNHLRLTDLLRSEIIEVNRSKDLDDTAPPPLFRSLLFIDWRSKSQSKSTFGSNKNE